MLRLAVQAASRRQAGHGSANQASHGQPVHSGAQRRMRPSTRRKLAKAAHSLSAEALGLDEFETLSREKAYLQTALGVSVEIHSTDEAGDDPKGKSARRNRGDRRFILSKVWIKVMLICRVIPGRSAVQYFIITSLVSKCVSFLE